MNCTPKSVPRRSKPSSPSPLHLHSYLRLLGYEEDKHVKVLGNPKVFEHPNHREFVFVIRFLLGLLDESGAEESFRHCYPPLDKKQEAEFRRKAFTWYKKIQSETPELVPVTASLFLSPGGRKFQVFLMAFLRWITHKIITSDPSSEEEILGPGFIASSPEFSQKPKEIYLKCKAKEFKGKALELHKDSEKLLARGKDIIQDMENRYRDMKAKKCLLASQDSLEDALAQRLELEEEVKEKTKNMNNVLKQLSLDMKAIQALRGEKKEPWSVLHICQEKISLQECVEVMSIELPPVYILDKCTLQTKELDSLAQLTGDLLPKVRRMSQKLSEELLNITQDIIPYTTKEVARIFESLKASLISPDENLKCLLPPTPSVDVKAAAPPPMSGCLSLLNSSSPSFKKTLPGYNTPPSRPHGYRIFPKKISPISNTKPPEMQQHHHLEDLSSSSVYDLRSLSTLSPVMTSSRMIASPGSPSLGNSTTSDPFVKTAYSAKTSAVLERFRSLKLQSNSPSIDSMNTSDLRIHSHPSTQSFEPLLPQPSVHQLSETSSPFHSSLSSSPLLGRLHKESMSLESEDRRFDKQERLTEELKGGGKSTPSTPSCSGDWMRKNGVHDSGPSFKLSQEMLFADKTKSHSESCIGSRLEELIESLGGNSEDLFALNDDLELPTFEL